MLTKTKKIVETSGEKILLCKYSENRKGIIIYNDSLYSIDLFFENSEISAFSINSRGMWETENEFFAKAKIMAKCVNYISVKVTTFTE